MSNNKHAPERTQCNQRVCHTLSIGMSHRKKTKSKMERVSEKKGNVLERTNECSTSLWRYDCVQVSQFYIRKFFVLLFLSCFSLQFPISFFSILSFAKIFFLSHFHSFTFSCLIHQVRKYMFVIFFRCSFFFVLLN